MEARHRPSCCWPTTSRPRRRCSTPRRCASPPTRPAPSTPRVATPRPARAARSRATFGLSTVGGEWRISELPEGFGRWIASSEVSRLVQPYDVHYVSTSRRALVPDTRWFPVDKLATRLARAQLVPVPPHLADASVTAVPAGARLLGDAVSIDSGVATVNLLSNTKLSAGESTRQNLWAQFVSTLTQDTGVTGSSCRSTACRSTSPASTALPATLAEVGFTTPPTPTLARPVVRRGDDVVVFDPATLGDPSPDSPWCRAATRRCCTPSAGSRCRPTAPSWRASTPTATASRAGAAPTATRCRSTPSTSGTPRTTGAATCGWAASAPRTPRRRGSGSSTCRSTPPTRVPRPPRSRRPGSRGAGWSSRGWPRTATGSPCSRPGSTGPTRRIDLAGIVRTARRPAAAARRTPCASVPR